MKVEADIIDPNKMLRDRGYMNDDMAQHVYLAAAMVREDGVDSDTAADDCGIDVADLHAYLDALRIKERDS